MEKIISYDEAKSQNLKIYNTGKPCKFGHRDGQYVSNRTCVRCAHRHNAERFFKNPEKIRRQKLKWQLKNQKENPEKFSAKAMRRHCEKLKRTPKWADLDAIERIYAWAKLATAVSGIKHHVDHVIPLRGKLVSGLHVAENLQILEATENLQKKNTWP